MSQRRFSHAKVVIIGGSGVGKSAFAVRYITKRFIGDYESNKEMMYNHKTNIGPSEVTLEILDTASQFPEEELLKHIKWGDGFILLYSVTDRKSLQEASRLKDLIHTHRDREIPIVLVANKCDLLTARAVTDDDGLSLAEEMDCQKFDISVAEGAHGVNEVMDELSYLMKREHVKSLTNTEIPSLEKRSKLFSMKNAIKKRIKRSRSDTY